MKQIYTKKNEVCIPHASPLFNLWKPESENAFLLITDVLLLAALSQCIWLCPGFSVYLGAQLIQLVLASLYLQHHFAPQWPATSFLLWCFMLIVRIWTCSPAKISKNTIAATAWPRHEAITATVSTERERSNMPSKPWQKSKRKGTEIYEVKMERQRRNFSFGVNGKKRAK